ncbi:O-antigen ligase [mine drainage metagenome]|uniref:O-antigen ligase n=1 Tax=mine drainage metagenome TaxID=410659 RepID=A0A1J5RVR1_9ZZZZ
MKPIFDVAVIQRALHSPMQWCVILIGIFVTMSVALDNLMLALILLGALPSMGSILRIVSWHPVARAAIMLFTMLFIAMFYGKTPLHEAFSILGKYVDLMFVPIFIYFLSEEKMRHRARYAFLFAMGITLFLSYLVDFRILSVMSWMSQFTEVKNPVIFYSHITQNNLMAFAIFLALLECRDAIDRMKQIAWCMFAAFGTVNVLFMVQGRTGYMILVALLTWFAWTSLTRYMHNRRRKWGLQQGALLGFGLVMMLSVTYYSSARLHERVALVVSEYQAWTPDHGKDTSTGQRLDFYYNTIQIVRDHFPFGIGTGGFPAAYAQQTEHKDVFQTRNPHNEYLMISVQTGLIGLVLLLYLFYMLWRHAPMLPVTLEQDAARGLVLAFILNCLVNSALHDHVDGLFFAFMTAALFAGLKKELRNA